MSDFIGVTGASGGLGQRLIGMLLERGFKVRCLLREGADFPLPETKKLQFRKGDISDYPSLEIFAKGLDCCIHLAARVSFTTRDHYFSVNCKGTENLCRAILAVNPGCRLIHCSTITVLNVKPACPWKSTPYALSKYFAEQTVLEYARRYGLIHTIIYPGMIFGGNEQHVLPGILRSLANGTMILLKGGEKNAHLIYIDDLCDLFIRVCENPAARGRRYVSVCGLDLGVHDIIRQVAVECGYPVPVKIYPVWPFKILAFFLSFYYGIFKPGTKPVLTRSLVNALSGSMAVYPTRLDDPHLDLGWRQRTSRETVIRQLRQALADHRQHSAVSDREEPAETLKHH